VLSASGSGIFSRTAGSRKAAKRANSSRRPLRTASPSSPSKSQKKRNGWRQPNSSPMKMSGGEGASSWMAESARSFCGSASVVSRSPKARLPTWSWFCRKSTKHDAGRWLDFSPRGSLLNGDTSPW